MSKVKENRLSIQHIKPGDIRALINWLDLPQNHNAAVNAIAVVPDAKRDKAFLDFLASSPAFQGWEYGQIASAVDQANEMDLMEKKMKQGEFKKLISEAVKGGISKAIKEKKAAPKAKITKSRLAEAVRKAVRTSLKESGMPGGAMPPTGKPAGTQMTAPTQEGMHDVDEARRGSSTFGHLPSVEEFQQALDEIGGWTMTLKGEDLRAFEEATGLSNDEAEMKMNSGKGMQEVLSDLMTSDSDVAMSLASSIMSVLGWEWV